MNAYIMGLAVGDVNGDKVDDIILGAMGIDQIYLIFGDTSLPEIIDLRDYYNSRIIGNIGDYTGSSISLGDINADGIKDILIAAPHGDGANNSRDNCGEAYLLFGHVGLPSTIDLEKETNFIIDGADPDDWLTGAGSIALVDINGDNIIDLIMGASNADGLNNQYINTGEAYVISRKHLISYTIDVATIEILAPWDTIFQDTAIKPEAKVKNFGLNAATFPVVFQIGTQYTAEMTLSLGSNDTATVIFPEWLASEPGPFTVSCSTACPGDENSTNDRKTGAVVVKQKPDFRLAADPECKTIYAGETATFSITINPIANFADTIVLSILPKIAGIESFFSPEEMIPPFPPSVLELVTDPRLVPGKYDFYIYGNAKQLSRSDTISLYVQTGELMIRPNPFTPNQDGFNDVVQFSFLGMGFTRPELKIFNMNGENILTLSQPIQSEFTWDGWDKDGRVQRPGVYLYLLQDGSKKIANGTIVLAM